MDFEEMKGYVGDIRAICIKYGLEGAEILEKYSDDQLAMIYNGIGPDSFPDWLVDIIDCLNPYLAPPAMIHDVEWIESDGKMSSFSASNRRFLANGHKMAKVTYRWYNPKRYIMMFNASTMAATCEAFGWPIWMKLNHRRFGDAKIVGMLMKACIG